MADASQRVLVIGCAGQDGTLLVEALSRAGDTVTGLTRSGIVLGEPRGPFDIRDAGQVRGLISRLRPDEVYYLAARHHSSEAPTPQDADLFRESLEINALALIAFLEAIRTASPSSRLFYASSSHVFGSAGPPIRDEQSPINPESIYGISKAAGMHACRFYRNTHGVFASTGIMFPHESPLRREGFVSKKIVRGAAEVKRGLAERIALGDLEAAVDWGYAPDFVSAMRSIVASHAPDDFVVATGICHTVREFAEVAFSSVGLDYREHVESRPDLLRRRPGAYAGNPAKLMRLAGWRPTIGFGDIVRLLVKAELESIEAHARRA